jgi:hypothetical protein
MKNLVLISNKSPNGQPTFLKNGSTPESGKRLSEGLYRAVGKLFLSFVYGK